MQNTAKLNYSGSVSSRDTQPGNELDLSTMLPGPHRASIHR